MLQIFSRKCKCYVYVFLVILLFGPLALLVFNVFIPVISNNRQKTTDGLMTWLSKNDSENVAHANARRLILYKAAQNKF